MALMFSVSGLRGIAGRDINEDIVYNYSAAFVKFTRAHKVVIGRDTRASGPRFRKAVIAGISSNRSHVIDLGVIPTPTVLFMVRKLKADCGIIITASHNPEYWNALKFVTKRGQFMNHNEFIRFSQMIKKNQHSRIKFPHKVMRYHKAIDDHIKFICQKLNKPKLDLKVGIDAVNGAASRALPLLCERLGCKVTRIHCQYSPKFPRGPEPVAENLDKLSDLVRHKHLDIGLACDPDGDRLAVVDESGHPQSEEMTIVLATDFVLRRKKGPVVVNLSTTALMEYIAALYHQPLYRSKVGEGNVVAEMLRKKAVIGGEGNGGVIYPAMNPGRDALVAAALILTMLKGSGKQLSEYLADYPSFFMIKRKIKISAPASDFNDKMRKIEKEIPGKIDRRDGLRILNRDFWIHIRPSQTESILRIIGESPNQIVIKKKINTVVKIIRDK